MVFRPEEEHRASRKADVGVPPIGGKQNVNQSLVAYFGPLSRSTSSRNGASQSAHVTSIRADWPSAAGIPNMSQAQLAHQSAFAP